MGQRLPPLWPDPCPLPALCCFLSGSHQSQAGAHRPFWVLRSLPPRALVLPSDTPPFDSMHTSGASPLCFKVHRALGRRQAGSGTWTALRCGGAHWLAECGGRGHHPEGSETDPPFTPQAWVLFGNGAGGGVRSGGSDGAGGTQAPARTPGRPGLREHFPGKQGGLLGGAHPS